MGRLAQVVESLAGLNSVTDYGYDAQDELTTVTQAQQSPPVTQTRTFAYSSLKRLTDATNPESGHVHYTYDDSANLKTKTDARTPAVVTTYIYDALNRVTSRTYSDSTLPVSFYYDAQTLPYTPASFTLGKSYGRLVAVTYGSGSTNGTYTGGYDELGRPATSVQRTELLDYRFGYVYNRAGAMTSETYPSSRVVATAYDVAGRINSVSSGTTTYANSFSYTSTGAVSAMSLSNGVMTEQTAYNARLQPTQIELRKVSGNVLILGLDYSYGATATNNGNISSQTIRIGTNAPFIDSYIYDGLNRLTQATETLNLTQQWQQTYDIDRWGNRAVRSGSYIPMSNIGLTPMSATSTDFSAFNQSTNRLSNSIQPQASIEYDDAGNLKKDAAGRPMSYDAENRLTNFNGGVGQYSYDGEGHRVKTIDSGGTTVFVYNAGGQLIAEYHSDPVPTPPGGGGTSYLTTDHLGSTRVVTKPDGTVKSRYDYVPFGEEIESNIGGRGSLGYGSADSTKQKFTQKERDNESGLDYFGARYYSNAQGRFTSSDPLISSGTIYDPQTWNRYAYTLNNPLKYTDAFGLYVFASGTTDELKKKFIQGLKNLQQARDSFKRGSAEYNRIDRALKAYAPGKDMKDGIANGVTVAFGATKDGAPAATSPPGINPDASGTNKLSTGDNPTGQAITVTIDPSQTKSADDYVTAIGHEGTHVADGSDLVGALPTDLTTAAAQAVLAGPLNLTQYVTETRAYEVESFVVQGLHKGTRTVGPGRYEIWNAGWSEADRAVKRSAGINNVLAYPKSQGGLYEVTPSNQGRKLMQ